MLEDSFSHAPAFEVADIHWKELQDVWNDPDRLLEAAQRLRSDNTINSLPVEQQRELIFRIAEQYDEKIRDLKDGAFDVFTVFDAFRPMHRNADGPDFIDTFALARRELFERYPYAADKLSDQLDQDAGVVDSNIYLTSLADIIRAPNLDERAKAGAYGGLAYQASFGLLPFIEQRVATLDTLPVSEALTILTLLEATADFGENQSFSERTSRALHKLLHTFAQSDVPALLRRKAEALTQRKNTDLLSTETSTSTIHDRRYANAVTLPVSRDHLGVYSRIGILIGLLPQHHHAPYTGADILHPAQLQEVRISPEQTDAQRERNETAQEDYAMFLDYHVLQSLERDYHFPITELTTREQLWFVASLRQYHKQEESRVQAFTQKFGIDGARTFLATEFGDDFRDTILNIADKFPENDAKQIFHQFSAIATLAQETADTIGKKFFVHDTAYNADAVRTELLSRAKDLLLTAEGTDADDITKKLERFTADTVLFASMFKVTQKGQVVKFEDIKGVHLESTQGNEITEEDKQTVIRVLTDNWSIQKPEALEDILMGIHDAFSNPASRFFILRRGGKIEAFIRFDEQNDGSLHGASLNVSPDFRGSGLGEAMMHNAIDFMAKDHVIRARVLPEIPVGMKYVDELGHVITGVNRTPGKNGAMVTYLLICRDDEKNPKYEGKYARDLSRYHSEQLRVLKFDLREGVEKMVATVEQETARGNVGTRYWQDPSNENIRYIAFEQNFEEGRLANAAK